MKIKTFDTNNYKYQVMKGIAKERLLIMNINLFAENCFKEKMCIYEYI